MQGGDFRWSLNLCLICGGALSVNDTSEFIPPSDKRGRFPYTSDWLLVTPREQRPRFFSLSGCVSKTPSTVGDQIQEEDCWCQVFALINLPIKSATRVPRCFPKDKFGEQPPATLILAHENFSTGSSVPGGQRPPPLLSANQQRHYLFFIRFPLASILLLLHNKS